MIRANLDRIEARLRQSEAVTEAEKGELLDLLETLRTEIDSLARMDAEQAESITGFAESTAREAMRQKRNPALLKLSAEGLVSSVEGFEVSHPRLVQIVNSFCTLLSNLGI